MQNSVKIANKIYSTSITYGSPRIVVLSRLLCSERFTSRKYPYNFAVEALDPRIRDAADQIFRTTSRHVSFIHNFREAVLWIRSTFIH